MTHLGKSGDIWDFERAVWCLIIFFLVVVLDMEVCLVLGYDNNNRGKWILSELWILFQRVG